MGSPYNAAVIAGTAAADAIERQGIQSGRKVEKSKTYRCFHTLLGCAFAAG